MLSATRVLPAANPPIGSYAEKGCSPPPGGAQPDKAGTDRGRASELNAFRRTPPRLSANPRHMSAGLPTGSQLGQPTVRDNRALTIGLRWTLWSTREFKTGFILLKGEF